MSVGSTASALGLYALAVVDREQGGRESLAKHEPDFRSLPRALERDTAAQ